MIFAPYERRQGLPTKPAAVYLGSRAELQERIGSYSGVPPAVSTSEVYPEVTRVTLSAGRCHASHVSQSKRRNINLP